MPPKSEKSDPNFGLNDAQLDAVKAPLGPVLVLAGAGSGKTRCLTMRMVYLIKKMNLAPYHILAITFTNKAAGEIKERIAKLLGRSSPELPTMGTFHSIGAKLVRAEAGLVGLNSKFVIYDDDDQERLLREILIQEKIDPTKFKPSLFAAIIDRAKNHLEQPGDLDHRDKSFLSIARRVYERYETALKQNNAVDFGDLLMLPVRIFQEHPAVLKKYQELWQYLLVDEYQDTNHAQYIFTKLLVAAHQNIFVVGDDAQAIYGFRGANFQNILDFEDDYPSAKIIRLEQNYRSTAPILSVAEKIIQLSPRQHKKSLWTENPGGGRPVLYAAADEVAEAYFVATKIVELQDESGDSQEMKYDYQSEDNSGEDGILSKLFQTSWSKVLKRLKNRDGLNQIAVLYRTHYQSRVLEEIFIQASIPYQIIGGLKFYERREIKDVIAYLRLIVNPNDWVSIMRIINTPPRRMGPQTKSLIQFKEALLQRDEKLLATVLDNRPQVRALFESLEWLNQIVDSANLVEVIRQLLKVIAYEPFLRDGSEEGETRWENVLELVNAASRFNQLPWREALEDLLEEVALMTSKDEADLTSPKVTMMTLHQAKGLEYDTVFMIGLEEGILPHARSIMDSNDIGEEIRLAYVGVTRARKNLFLVYAQSRKTFGTRNFSTPSRILKAIPRELLEVKEGSSIWD